MRFLLITVFFSMALVPFESPLGAQQVSDTSHPQPTPPYLAPVPSNLHWIVTFSYVEKTDSGTKPAPPPANCPVSIETTKVGSTRRIVVKFANSPPQQFDIFDKDCYAQDPPLGLQCRRLGGDYIPFMFFDLGFAFTQCVNPASFKEYTTYQDVPVFHYQDGSTEAWISAETRLPIGADQIGSVKTSYQYLAAPDSNAIVPTPEEQKSMQIQKAATDAFKALR
jgi:hypothetical protein